MLLDSEFTTRDVYNYVTSAYGTQVNGRPFSFDMIHQWIRTGSFPPAYGGNKILSTRKIFDKVVLTVEGLSRNDLVDTFGELSKITSSLKQDRRVIPKRMRTPLYFEILGKRSQRKVNKQKEATLPQNFKKIGIKRNQIT